MSIFFPYDINTLLSAYENIFNIDLSLLTDYQKTVLLIGTNLYFFIMWFIIIWVVLKSISYTYKRLF